MTGRSLALVSLVAGCAVAPDSPEHLGTNTAYINCSWGCTDEVPLQGEHFLGASLDALPAPPGHTFSVQLKGTDADLNTAVSVAMGIDMTLDITRSGATPTRFESGRIILPGTPLDSKLPTIANGELRVTAVGPAQSAVIANQTRLASFYLVEWREKSTEEFKPMCEGEAALPVFHDFSSTRQHLHPAKSSDPSDRLTFACPDGIVEKCPKWGYLVGTQYSTQSRSEWQVNQACLRAAAFDACNSGVPHTREGTAIKLFDEVGVRTPPPEVFLGVQSWPPTLARMYFEAAWRGDDPTGKPQTPVCISKLRWSSLPAKVCGVTNKSLPDPRDSVAADSCDEKIGTWKNIGDPEGGHALETFSNVNDVVLFEASDYNELAMIPWSNGVDKVTTIDGYVDADSRQVKHPYATGFNPDPFQVQGMLLRKPYAELGPESDGNYQTVYLWQRGADRVIAPAGLTELANHTQLAAQGYVYTEQYAAGRSDMTPFYLYTQNIVPPFTPGYTSSTTQPANYSSRKLLGYLRAIVPPE